MVKRLDRIRDRIGVGLCRLAYRIMPPERGEPCLDCGNPLPDGDTPCQVCIDGWEQQRRDRDVYGSGYEDAMREVERTGPGSTS